jgi:hypothetical protein
MPEPYTVELLITMSFAAADIPAIHEAHTRALFNAEMHPSELNRQPDDYPNIIADIFNFGTTLPPIWKGGHGALVAEPLTNPTPKEPTQ